MTELEFKNTNPTFYAEGNANLLYSSSIGTGSYELPANHYGASGSFSYDLVLNNVQTGGHGKEYYKADALFPPYKLLGLTIPFNSANDVALEETLSSVTDIKFTIGGTPVKTKVTQIAKNQGYFFIRLLPKEVLVFPTGIDNSGTPLDLVVEFIFSPYLAAKFNNSDFNALIGNASNNVQSNVALQVDRSTDLLTPPNLDAIISRTATRAQIQYSNYTVAGWTNARYEGSKLNSGSIFGDDPAQAYKSFKGGVFPLDGDNTQIKNTDGGNVQDIYFNVDRRPTDYLRIGEPFRTGSTFPEVSGSLTYTGSGSNSGGNFIGNLLFEEQGNKFVRIVDKKILAIDKGTVYTTDELGRIILEQ